jgi:hypothetical protein
MTCTVHSVRSLFSRALLAPESRVKHSILLWSKWLDFESSRTAKKTPAGSSSALDQVKQVLLDGLRSLPWSKAWVIRGLRLFSQENGMGTRELRQVYNVLTERELRIRMDAEEMEAAIAALR